MFVCDWVLRDVGADLAALPPERGGALLGLPGRPLLTRYEPDPTAAAGARSWAPSRALAARVQELEREEGLELKGLVHSHPRGLDRPSEQDALELGEGLRRNGHLASYLGPIVCEGAPPPRLPHELALGAAKIAFFAGWRTGAGAARVAPLAVQVIPLWRDLTRLAAELGEGVPEVFATGRAGPAGPAGRLCLDGLELLVLASELYPTVPPILLATPGGGRTEQLDLRWRLETPEEERLARAVREHVAPPGPFRRVFGPPVARP